MRCFKNPVRVFGICNRLLTPFDLKMAGSLFEKGRSREVMHVEFGLWRHYCEWMKLHRSK